MINNPRNKEILVTGATGFIGANLVHKLISNRCNVNIIKRRESNLWRLNNNLNDIRTFDANLENYAEVKKVVENVKPEIIYHLATYGGFSYQKDTYKIIDTNIIGTMNLLKACMKNGFSLFVNTGSSSEYGIKDKPILESDSLEPITPYGLTKATVSSFLSKMGKLQNLPIVTFRLFSPYGYYEDKNRLMPHLILSCLKNRNPQLSSPDSVRDFVFIEDVIDAYLSIPNKEEINGEVFNIAGGKQHDVDSIARLAIKLIDDDVIPEYRTAQSTQLKEPKTWLADISNAERILNWRPKNNIDTGLKKNIDWFKENLSLYEEND